MDTPVIILVSPQMGENIGAAARVMSNFGLHYLRIITPRDGWPNPKAIDMAAHGAFVLEQAKIYEYLEAGLADIQYLVATSSNMRELSKTVTNVRTGIQWASNKMSSGNRTAIMFGCERSGLSNEQLVLADAIMTIQTSPRNPSLNLAQAVAVVSYEWSQTADAPMTDDVDHRYDLSPQASKDELLQLSSHLESELERAGFFQVAEKKARMMRNINNTMIKAGLSTQEARTLHGMINALKRK